METPVTEEQPVLVVDVDGGQVGRSCATIETSSAPGHHLAEQDSAYGLRRHRPA